MARPSDRLPDNASGEFFVDSSCIDCDTCRRIAPENFAEGAGFSFVGRQPATEAERLRSFMALVACPTASIGTESGASASPGVSAFPEPIEAGVHFCGFTSEDSFGAWSYFCVRDGGAGNFIVDSPRAASPLMARMEEMGGAKLMFLTHRDDVADHEKYHARFGCARVLHADDVTASTRGVERKLRGGDPIQLDPDLLAIPVPGHTKGHAVLLYKDTFLFAGDHLAWSPEREALHAFRGACWYSWKEQILSMERLLEHRFTWVLPGHGWRYRAASAGEMRAQLERCIAWMKKKA